MSVEIKPDGELATAGARRRRLQDATNSTSENTTVVETEESTNSTATTTESNSTDTTAESNSTDTTADSNSTDTTNCTCTVSNTTTESNVTDTSNSTDTTTNCTCTEEVTEEVTEEEVLEEEVLEEEEEVIDWANVEFIQNHPHVRHTVQQIAIDQDNVFETWSVTVTNPDAGTYKLNFLHPVSGNVWTSDPIAANSNRWQFR